MNLPTIIFLIVSAFLLGIAAGGYVTSLRQDAKHGQADEKSQADDLIRLRKDTDSGTLEVVLAGKDFHTPGEMSSSERALAGYAFNDLKTWLNPQAAPARSAAISAAGDVPVELPVPAESAPETAPVPPVIAAVAQPAGLNQQDSLVVDVPEEEASTKRKRGGIAGVLSRALGTEVSPARLAPVSIANQVNLILQKNLKDMQLEDRGICLMELPGHDMVVMIGLDKYETVSSVPDDEIRTVIQSAVNEWLTRNTA
jgi:hypothetical protein